MLVRNVLKDLKGKKKIYMSSREDNTKKKTVYFRTTLETACNTYIFLIE